MVVAKTKLIFQNWGFLTHLHPFCHRATSRTTLPPLMHVCTLHLQMALPRHACPPPPGPGVCVNRVLRRALVSRAENFEMLRREDDGKTAVEIGNPATAEFEVGGCSVA